MYIEERGWVKAKILLTKMSGIQEVGHIINTVVLIFQYFQFLYLIYSEVAWVPVSLGTQVQPQIILEPDYLKNFLSISCDYGFPYSEQEYIWWNIVLWIYW